MHAHTRACQHTFSSFLRHEGLAAEKGLNLQPLQSHTTHSDTAKCWQVEAELQNQNAEMKDFGLRSNTITPHHCANIATPPLCQHSHPTPSCCTTIRFVTIPLFNASDDHMPSVMMKHAFIHSAFAIIMLAFPYSSVVAVPTAIQSSSVMTMLAIIQSSSTIPMPDVIHSSSTITTLAVIHSSSIITILATIQSSSVTTMLAGILSSSIMVTVLCIPHHHQSLQCLVTSTFLSPVYRLVSTSYKYSGGRGRGGGSPFW